MLVRPIFSLAVGAILIATSLPAAAGETARPAGVEPGHTDEVSAAKRKKRSSGQQAYGHSGTQFDEVVCPYRRCRVVPLHKLATMKADARRRAVAKSD